MTPEESERRAARYSSSWMRRWKTRFLRVIPCRIATSQDTEALDEALADSFPASDPVSIVTSQDEEDWGAGASARLAPRQQTETKAP